MKVAIPYSVTWQEATGWEKSPDRYPSFLWRTPPGTTKSPAAARILEMMQIQPTVEWAHGREAVDIGAPFIVWHGLYTLGDLQSFLDDPGADDRLDEAGMRIADLKRSTPSDRALDVARALMFEGVNIEDVGPHDGGRAFWLKELPNVEYPNGKMTRQALLPAESAYIERYVD